MTNYLVSTISENVDSLEDDYNEASYLYPFWSNYPPEDRGRSPIGDQIPWIEVGEHSIGENVSRIMFKKARIREVGLPSGPDDRFVIKSDFIRQSTSFTDSAMLFMDIKSVGPRDDADHIVLSPYQASGDGIWTSKTEMLSNSIITAQGHRASHPFSPAMSPIYCLTDGTIAPTVHLFVKPVYSMANMEDENKIGQPLKRIDVICMPNGLLLTTNPNYCERYPGLLFPGKDDKTKPLSKLRCRVSFELLRQIAPWRVQTIKID